MAHAHRRPNLRFLFAHPAHLIALGAGAGLAPRAPGTVGSLWAWAAWLALDPWLGDAAWGGVLVLATLVGVWACTRTAQHLGVADPGAIVWDEVIGLWLVMWLWTPASLPAQALAFALFRLFDSVKRGPVGWADALFKPRQGQPVGWRQGLGIVFDDVVAAGCTLLVLAAGHRLWPW